MPVRASPAAFAPDSRARPPRYLVFGVTCAFAFATARQTRWPSQMMVVSAGFEGSVSFPPAAQATGLRLLPWHVYLLLERTEHSSGRTSWHTNGTNFGSLHTLLPSGIGSPHQTSKYKHGLPI